LHDARPRLADVATRARTGGYLLEASTASGARHARALRQRGRLARGADAPLRKLSRTLILERAQVDLGHLHLGERGADVVAAALVVDDLAGVDFHALGNADFFAIHMRAFIRNTLSTVEQCSSVVSS
jgi:hypothetical protein